MNAINDEKIPRLGFFASWVILGAASLVGVLFFSWAFVLGIVSGGLIAALNFSIMSRTLKKALSVDIKAGYGSVIAKYYLRLLVSGLAILGLLATDVVHPIGLIIGLSVVVAGIFAALFYELTFHFKEAG